MRHGQSSICFPSLHQVPIDVTAGWAASPVGTRPPGPHFNSWVDWSNVSKVSCSRKQQQHQSGPAGNRTWNLLITRRTHTHAHTHTKQKQSLQQPCETQLLSPSEPALGCLCTTQAIEPCAGKSSWGRASNLQDCPGLTERLRNPKFHNNPNTAK